MTNTILMIHGVCSSADAFVKLAPAFRQMGWRVEAPTLRADKRPHENPPADLPKVALADYVADMEAVARKIEAETGAKPVLMGHSMGGLLVQKLLEKGVGAAGILITPASPAGAQGKRSLAQLITFGNAAVLRNPETKAIRIWRTGFEYGVLNCVPKARHAELWKGNLYDSGRVVRDLAYPHKDPNKTAYVDEKKIKVPMLVIGAGKDRTTPIDGVRKAAAKYAKVGADYREYPNNAHWIVDEPGTDKVIADIAAWLEAKGLKPGVAKVAAAPKAAVVKKAKAPAATKAEPVKAKAPARKAEPAKAKAPVKKAAAVAKAAPAKAKTVAKKTAATVKKAAAPVKAAAKKAAAPMKAKAVAKPAKPAAKAKAPAKPKAAVKPKAAAKPAAPAKAKAAPKKAAAPAPAKAKPAAPKAVAKPAAKKAAPKVKEPA